MEKWVKNERRGRKERIPRKDGVPERGGRRITLNNKDGRREERRGRRESQETGGEGM
jgi:hypothetical protein